jgi:hypothetical protein
VIELDPKVTKRALGGTFGENTDAQKDIVWENAKNLPADLLQNIDKHIRNWTHGANLESFYLGLGPIAKMMQTGDNVGIIAHELGHARDGQRLFKIRKDPKLIKVYNEEIEKFNKATTSDIQGHNSYFLQTGGSGSTGLSELIAEAKSLFVTYGHDTEEVATRAHLLARHFPKSIAQVAKLLNMDGVK